MSPITLQQLVEWGKAESPLPASLLRRHIGSVWMDSRKIVAGDVFIALKSDTDDGHNYVSTALHSGALAGIVSRKEISRYSVREQKRLIIVSNPLRAVQKMAAEYRQQLDMPIIAVTGSSGKTTTRQFITSVLAAGLSVGNTVGNWNNHIGVPLSILRLTGREDVAIVELGANHKNEINTLTRIVKPDVSVITNIGYAHIGYFGSLDAIAHAKFEIVNGMHKKLGLLLLNGDDTRLIKKNAEKGYKAVYFGFSSRCGIRAENVTVSAGGGTVFSVKGYTYRLSMPGRHFVYCALPGIFLARQLGISEKSIAKALYALKPDQMRGRIVTKAGITFIVDCYNANPSSMKSGLSLLEDVADGKKRCAIVGDMLELGKYSRRLHKQLGNRLADAGVQKILAVGGFAGSIAEGAKQRGVKASNIHCSPDAESAASCARSIFKRGDIVLLKGSRGVRLEKVFNTFE